MAKGKNSLSKHDKYQKSTLVCVTDQKRCENLIEAGRKIADDTNTNLYVINVNKMDTGGRQTDLHALEHLFSVSKKNDAVMNVFYGVNIGEVLERATLEYQAENVVTGVPENDKSVVVKMWNKLSIMQFYMVNIDGKITKVGKSQRKAVYTA